MVIQIHPAVFNAVFSFSHAQRGILSITKLRNPFRNGADELPFIHGVRIIHTGCHTCNSLSAGADAAAIDDDIRGACCGRAIGHRNGGKGRCHGGGNGHLAAILGEGYIISCFQSRRTSRLNGLAAAAGRAGGARLGGSGQSPAVLEGGNGLMIFIDGADGLIKLASIHGIGTGRTDPSGRHIGDRPLVVFRPDADRTGRIRPGKGPFAAADLIGRGTDRFMRHGPASQRHGGRGLGSCALPDGNPVCDAFFCGSGSISDGDGIFSIGNGTVSDGGAVVSIRLCIRTEGRSIETRSGRLISHGAGGCAARRCSHADCQSIDAGRAVVIIVAIACRSAAHAVEMRSGRIELGYVYRIRRFCPGFQIGDFTPGNTESLSFAAVSLPA